MFEETLSAFEETLSVFEETLSVFEETLSAFEETLSLSSRVESSRCSKRRSRHSKSTDARGSTSWNLSHRVARHLESSSRCSKRRSRHSKSADARGSTSWNLSHRVARRSKRRSRHSKSTDASGSPSWSLAHRVAGPAQGDSRRSTRRSRRGAPPGYEGCEGERMSVSCVKVGARYPGKMQSWRSLGVLGALVVLAGCGSGNSTVGFQTGDGSVDASQGAETGTLHRGKDGGGGNNKDGSTHTLGNPDTGGGTCSKPVTCASAGANCGSLSNGCGGTVQCGTCLTPETCGGGGTAGVCGTPCTPKTCADLGFNCGPAGDGCGGSLDCGTCSDGGTCGGGGTAEPVRVEHDVRPEDVRGARLQLRPRGRRLRQPAAVRHVHRVRLVRRRRHGERLRRPDVHPEDVRGARLHLRPCQRRLRQRLQCGTCTAPPRAEGAASPACADARGRAPSCRRARRG